MIIAEWPIRLLSDHGEKATYEVRSSGSYEVLQSNRLRYRDVVHRPANYSTKSSPHGSRWSKMGGSTKRINISGTTYAMKISCDINCVLLIRWEALYNYGESPYTPAHTRTTHPAGLSNQIPTVAVEYQRLWFSTAVSKVPWTSHLFLLVKRGVWGILQERKNKTRFQIRCQSGRIRLFEASPSCMIPSDRSNSLLYAAVLLLP